MSGFLNVMLDETHRGSSHQRDLRLLRYRIAHVVDSGLGSGEAAQTVILILTAPSAEAETLSRWYSSEGFSSLTAPF